VEEEKLKKARENRDCIALFTAFGEGVNPIRIQDELGGPPLHYSCVLCAVCSGCCSRRLVVPLGWVSGASLRCQVARCSGFYWEAFRN